MRRSTADPDKYEAIIQANQKAHHDAGHWGVPTMAFQGEPFFGQDRLDVLLWRLKQNGLKPQRVSMRKFLLIAAGAIVVLVVGGAWWRSAVHRSICGCSGRWRRRSFRGPTPVLAKPDELSVLLCGTGTPLARPPTRGALHDDRGGQRIFM